MDFGVQGGFQMVQQDGSSALTKYEPVASHEDPIYNNFHGYGEALSTQPAPQINFVETLLCQVK